MSLVWLALAGALTGAGLWAAVYALRRPSLAELLADSPAPEPGAPEREAVSGWARRHGRPGIRLLAVCGFPRARVTRALRLTGTDTDAYLAEKATAAACAVALPAVLLLAVAGLGLPLAPPVLLVLAAGSGAACWLAPDLAVLGKASERRAELRAATSSLADLVVMGLAGGAGITGALTAAAQRGQGWAPDRIRLALRTAVLQHRPPWEGLAELSEQTQVRELGELAASIRLGGADGARTKASITAKAASLRAKELTATDAASQAATERMSLPVMVLVGGFLLLISYPAIAHITSGF